MIHSATHSNTHTKVVEEEDYVTTFLLYVFLPTTRTPKKPQGPPLKQGKSFGPQNDVTAHTSLLGPCRRPQKSSSQFLWLIRTTDCLFLSASRDQEAIHVTSWDVTISTRHIINVCFCRCRGKLQNTLHVTTFLFLRVRKTYAMDAEVCMKL